MNEEDELVVAAEKLSGEADHIHHWMMMQSSKSPDFQLAIIETAVWCLASQTLRDGGDVFTEVHLFGERTLNAATQLQAMQEAEGKAKS